MAKIIKVKEEQNRNGEEVRSHCIVYYESGRVREYVHFEIPKTVWAFIEKATVTESFRDWNKTVLTHIIVDDEPDTSEEQPENTAESAPEREFDREVCRCCKSCTRLSECDKVMTYDAFSNVTEEMECRCCDGEYTCCSGFTPKLNPKELAYINPDYVSQECELCSECIHYPECKEKGTVVMQHDGLCMYSVCPSSVCCQNFTPELPF